MLDPGRRLGPYEILGPLGRGGMGEVYRARDLRLDREVAVKVVPEPLARDPGRLARFEREARAVAALAHPNILVLYDVGHEQGIPFAVTELLEGTNLRGRMTGPPVPWREVLDIGAAVADGLAAAHVKGIVHRDLKPENLFLTADRRVKILDFGLARVDPLPTDAEAETGAYDPARTGPGAILGTPGYMSPEQVRGLPADGRADLFALGCVLFELLAGRRPFQGATPADTAAAILNQDPPPLADVPAAVGRVVMQCLAKDPADRFSSAADLAGALRALLGGSDVEPTSARPARRRRAAARSVAVLPLANATADPEADYLADGITEGVIDRLARLPGLRVMARSTVFRYKGRPADAQEVGRALKVRAVLTGRLVRRSDRLAIRVELVAVRDGTQLWGEEYHRDLADLPGLEQAIAQAVADALHVRLTGPQRRRLDRPPTDSPEAYQCYLKGRYHWNKRTGDGLRKSIKLFEQAIDHDAAYALAYAGVADAYLNLGGWGHLPFREAYPRARAAADRALAIDDGLGEAWASRAMVQKEYDWDWSGAGRSYARALELSPSYAVAHQWFGEYLAALGRHAEAIAAMRRAIDLDPLSLIIQCTLGRHGYYFARRYDEAAAQLRKVLELDDQFWVAHFWLAVVYSQLGRLEEALGHLETARRLDGNLEIVMFLGYVHGRAGRAAEARQVLDELDQLRTRRYVSPMLPAIVWIGLGEADRAFDWLERAYAERVQMLTELAAEPAFDPLRPAPRFVDLLRRVGLS
jgi:eukaryotic-like serine/threonine-protein kinase